jgi:hypothetical protein
MNLQYISDNKGKTTGVFIPIKDWEELKKEINGLSEKEKQLFEIPEEYKNIVRERIKASDADPSRLLDWDKAKHQLKYKNA